MPEHSLDLIGAYSIGNFGSKRGEAYVDALLVRCRRIAMGNAPTHSCRHFIIFTETPDEILIVDFIHQSGDIGGRLEGVEHKVVNEGAAPMRFVEVELKDAPSLTPPPAP